MSDPAPPPARQRGFSFRLKISLLAVLAAGVPRAGFEVRA